jgi:hypothetical protein
MATLSDLVRVVAAVQGMDETSVMVMARLAREAGHISQGGRGFSAARMTVRDGANLLIAVNASPTGKDVAATIKRYRSLRPAFRHIDEGLSTSGVLARFFDGEIRFGDALEEVIKGATPITVTAPSLFGGDATVSNGGGLFDDLRHVDQSFKNRGIATDARLKVSFVQPIAAACISLGGDDDFSKDAKGNLVSTLQAEFVWEEKKSQKGDRRTVTTISDRTITAVAKILGE